MVGADTGIETGGAAALEMAAAAALERGEKINPCRNCGSPVLGIYCGQCGQPVDTHRRSVFHLLYDVAKDIISFDTRILRTARALFLEPGELPLAFREGRTQRYVPPIRLYLFVSLIFFLTLSVTHVAIFQLGLTTTTTRYLADAGGRVLEERDGATGIVTGLKADKNGTIFADGTHSDDYEHLIGTKADGAMKTDLDARPRFFARAEEGVRPVSPQLRAILDRTEKGISVSPGAARLHLDPKRILETLASNPSAINTPLIEWIPRALFVLVPVFALLLAAFYWRQRTDFYFVDHLVFSLNIFSVAFVVILLAIALAQIIPGGNVAFLAVCAISLHLFLAMKRFYRQNWGRTAIKFAAISFVNGVFFLGPAMLGIILAALWNLS